MATVMAFGITACGNNASQETATEPGTQELKAEENVLTDEKILNCGSTGYFATEKLDPANGWDGWYLMYSGTTETLFKLDKTMTPQPFLAEFCENIDGLTWKVTLRDDVTFQNGEKMTAEAVKKCFDRTYEISDRAKEQISIDFLEADGQVLTFHLQNENVTLMNDLTDPLWSVYDSENSDYKETLYCTGPYMVTEMEPFVETDSVKYDDYWGGEPKLDEIHLITISDAEALSMALQSGEIDMAVAMPTSAVSTFEGNADYVVDAVTTSRGNRLYYNMDRTAMSDIAVRQAISMCIDRDGVASSIYYGLATPSWGIFPDFLSYGGTEGLELMVDKYDTEGAAALLEAAGWVDEDGDGIRDKDGVALNLRAVTSASRKELGQFLELLQTELSGIGIQLTVDVLESTSDVEASGDYDIDCVSGVMVPTGNAQYFFNTQAVTDASSNRSKYSNPELDSLAKELEITGDEAERTELIRQMSQMILDDEAMVFYNHQMMVNVYSLSVKNFSTHPSEYYLVDVNTDIER